MELSVTLHEADASRCLEVGKESFSDVVGPGLDKPTSRRGKIGHSRIPS